jgi:superfamily II DNA or RNA helicase
MSFNIEEVAWSEPRVIDTRVGPRQVRTWKPPRGHPFWDTWSTGYLKEQGYSLRKWKDEWEVTEWRDEWGNPLDGDGATANRARENDDLSATAEAVDVELPRVLQARYEEVERIYDAIEADTAFDYRYQLPTVRQLALAIHTYSGALDASDLGTGKTAIACAVARVLGRELFVVCPKTVIAPWHRLARLFEVEATVVNYEALRTGNTPYAYAFKERIVTADGTVKFRRRFVWDALGIDPEATLFMFDDCHKMKDFKTWNCLMGIKALEQGFKVLAGSGTAADNPMQMKFVALLTGLIAKPGEFYGWMTDHGVKRGRWGLQFVGGRSVLARIHRQIFPAHGARIRIADLGDRFPSTKIISEAFDMGEKATHEIQAIYADMHREIAKLEASEQSDNRKKACILTEILRARQRAELLKVPTLVDMTRDAVEEGMNVALFLNFDDSIKAAARLLNTQATITGSDKLANRQNVIDRFNADDIHIVIANIKAGGTGVSLQGRVGGRHRLGLISPTYSAIDFKQSTGRLPRAGGVPSIQKVVWAADTVEVNACAKVQRKLRNIEALNDGDLAL